MKGQKRKSENGGETKVGQERRKQKQSEEIGENGGQSSHLCVKDPGNQVGIVSASEENGVNNGDEMFDNRVFQELFGEDEGGILVNEELQGSNGKEACENGGLSASGEITLRENSGLDFTSELFEGLFGEISAENGGTGPSGGGIDSLFDEVHGGDGNGSMDFCGQGFGLFGSLDGNGIHGPAGEIECQNGGETCRKEGDQGEFSVNRNVNCSKNEIVKIKNKRGRPKGAKNKTKVLGDKKRTEGLSKVGDGGKTDEIMRHKKKRGRPKGWRKQKLEGQNQELPYNGKDGGDKIALENGGTVDLGVEVKVMTGEVTGGSNEIFGSKVRRGRPKGTKNKKKIIAVEETHGMRDQIVDGKYFSVENVCPLGSENGRTTLVGEDIGKQFEAAGGKGGGDENVRPKKKRGRPKGSNNNKKIPNAQENLAWSSGDGIGQPKDRQDQPTDVDEYQGMHGEIERVLNGIVGTNLPVDTIGGDGTVRKNLKPNVQRGRPKSFKNNKQNLADGPQEMPSHIVCGGDGYDRNVRPQGLEKGTTLLDEEDRLVNVEATEGDGIEYLSSGTKYKPDQPKVSRNKGEILAGYNHEMTGEILIYDDGCIKNVEPLDLENERTSFVSDGNRQLVVEAANDIDGKHEIFQPRNKFGQPKGLNNKEILSAEEMIEQLSGGDEIVPLKRKRGRPKGSKTKKKCLTGEENHGVLGVIVCDNDSSHKNVLPMSSESMRIARVGEEDKEMFCQVSDGDF